MNWVGITKAGAQIMIAGFLQTPLEYKGNPTKVFIGHTPTMYWDKTTPMKAADRIINVDTGSGKGGLLTIMDIHTEEYWQV
jgi:hypothetical protein